MKFILIYDGEEVGSFDITDAKLGGLSGDAEILAKMPLVLFGGDEMGDYMRDPENDDELMSIIDSWACSEGYTIAKATEKSLTKYGTHEGACAAVESRGATPREACGGSTERTGRGRRAADASKNYRGKKSTWGKRSSKMWSYRIDDKIQEKYPELTKVISDAIIGELPHGVSGKGLHFELMADEDVPERDKPYLAWVSREDGHITLKESTAQKLDQTITGWYDRIAQTRSEIEDKLVDPADLTWDDLTPGERQCIVSDCDTLFHEVAHVYDYYAGRLPDGEVYVPNAKENWASGEAFYIYEDNRDVIDEKYHEYKTMLTEASKNPKVIGIFGGAPEGEDDRLYAQTEVLGSMYQYASTNEREFFACHFSSYCMMPQTYKEKNPEMYELMKLALGGWESDFTGWREKNTKTTFAGQPLIDRTGKG